MDRLRREHGRELVGAAFVVAAVTVMLIGYVNIRDEIQVAIQLPYILTGSIGAVILVAVGVAVLRSQDDKVILHRLAQLESTNAELSDRVGYLGQLLEIAILPDEMDVRTPAPGPGVAVAAEAR
jgi:hypothetical protein